MALIVCIVSGNFNLLTINTMKTFFTILVITIISFGAFAQFEQGNMLVGGAVGAKFNTEKTKFEGTTDTDGKFTEFTLSPQFGYFVINNLAVGGGLDLTLQSYKPDGLDGKSTATLLLFSPFARYYFRPGIFLQSKFHLGSRKYKNDIGQNTNESKNGVSGWSLGAGYAAFLNDNVAIEPMLGFESLSYKDKDSNQNVKDISSGIFLRVGFQIYLRK
jgi:hypothetical protein